jgi:hypothetical protein
MSGVLVLAPGMSFALFQCAGIMPSNAATTGLKFGPDFGVLGRESAFAHCDCVIDDRDRCGGPVGSPDIIDYGLQCRVPIAVWSYDRF